jgi:7-cyano-7-deazaguanine synthase
MVYKDVGEKIMILLFSGGIDSFVAYHYLGRPQTVYFDLGTPYTQKEIKVIQELIPETIIDNSLNLGSRQIGDKAYVPFRNLYLAMLAVKYDDTIVIAGVKDDDVSDKNEPIFEKFSELLSELEGREINIISPFWVMTKEDVVEWYLENHPNDDLLLKTVSCYSKEDTNYCGMCPSCFRKWCALKANGINLDFFNESLLKEYRQKALEGHYIPERNELIIKLTKEY